MFLPHCRYRNIIKAVIVIIVVAAFAALIIFAKDFISDSINQYSTTSATEAYVNLNAVQIENEQYLPKANIKNVLIIGLDIDGKIVSSNSYNNEYNADFLLLASFDVDSKACKLVEINRDSVVPVQRLDIFGQKVDKQNMQITLSYSYGDGLGISAQNTVQAVSDIFYGLNIDYYMVISRDATRLAVDYLGGIDVTMDDNYTDIDTSYTKHTVHHMNSEQAMNFVSARYGTIKGTNIYRMQRQICLINNIVTNLQKSNCDFTQLYDSFSEFTICDIDFGTFSKVVSNLGEYQISSVITPAGKSVVNYGYTEFYMEDSSIKAIAQEVFYDKI